MKSHALSAAGPNAPPCASSKTEASSKPEVLAYLNRLSDVIWLFGRLIEHNAGIDTRLRDDRQGRPEVLKGMVMSPYDRHLRHSAIPSARRSIVSSQSGATCAEGSLGSVHHWQAGVRPSSRAQLL